MQSYSGKGIDDTQGTIMFSRQISSIAEGKDFEKSLLIDDLSDTGLTLNKSIEWLKNHEPIKDFIKEIKTGCLWRKKKINLYSRFLSCKFAQLTLDSAAL